MKSLSTQSTKTASKASKSKKPAFETANLTNNDVALILLDLAHKRKLINKKKKSFSSNATFSAHYNSSELSSILNETIAKVIKSFEVYIARRKGLKVEEPVFEDDCDLESLECLYEQLDGESDEEYQERLLSKKASLVKKKSGVPNISDDLDLSTIGNLHGYFITAFNQNVSKDYKKNNGKKRKGDTVSYDGAADEEDKEAHAIFNQLKTNSIEDRDDAEEYKRIITTAWRFLRAYDKACNFELSRKRMSPKKDKTSQLAYLFLYLVDPKYKGKYVHIKGKFPTWSNYIYDKNFETMVQLLKQKFPQEMSFFYEYLMGKNTEFGTTVRPNMTKNYYDQSCSVTTSLNEKYMGNQVMLSVDVHLYRLENGKNTILQTETISKTVDMKNKDEAKVELKKEAEVVISKLKENADKRRRAALTEIYAY